MQPPRLVLLRPRNADNLGAIARAMKNFGWRDWVVVSPNPNLLEAPGLNRLAVKAGDLLDVVRVVPTFSEAIHDCTLVVGTTMRFIEGRRRMTPRELYESTHIRDAAPWALVFGDERSGLTNEDLECCHHLSFIPSAEEQPSLNLAQAVMVYAYEYAMVARGTVFTPAPALATVVQLEELERSMTAALRAVGLFQEARPDALRTLMQTLQRSALKTSEASLWTTAFRVLRQR